MRFSGVKISLRGDSVVVTPLYKDSKGKQVSAGAMVERAADLATAMMSLLQRLVNRGDTTV